MHPPPPPHLSSKNTVVCYFIIMFSIRSSICSRESHLNSERDLRHAGVDPAQGHGGQRGHHLQRSLQEVLWGRAQVRPLWQQRSLCPPAVRLHGDGGADHRPAAGLQLQPHRGEPERGFGLESLPQGDRHGQRHHVADG